MNKFFAQDQAHVIADNMCCASTALWIMGIDEHHHLSIIADEIGKGLEEDCTVKWKEFFRNVSGREINVVFKDIRSLSDLANIKGKIAVKFAIGKSAHWVGVENCKVVYNSLKVSNCVTNGKPVTARIITLK